MATEADIPVPVCEAREEQVGNFVDNIIKISVSQLPLQKQAQDNKHNELPIVEGENFFKPPSIVEVNCEPNKDSPDVSKVIEESDQTVKEKTSAEESQQNGEESNSKDGDGDRGVPEQCSTDSTVVTPEMDDAMGVVAQLSKDTSSDHHGTNDTFTEKIELTKEILQEASLPREETKSHTTCISEGEELNVLLKTTDNKSTDEKPTKENMSSNLTNKVASEQEALENEKRVEDNFNTAAEKVSREDCTSTEKIITLETSNSDELESKSDLNSLLHEEEEMAVQKDERYLTTSEDAAIDHGDPKLAEKYEESSLVQVEDSQIERDEQHLEEESERQPLTEVLTEGTNDNVPEATDNVKEKDEDLKEAELSENEQSTRCTSVKEDMHVENHAESLQLAPGNIEVSDLSQVEGPPEEQSRSVTLQGNTIEAEEATIDADNEQKESLESFPPIVSSLQEEESMNAALQEATSDYTDGKIIDEVDKHEEVLENLSSGKARCDVNNVSSDVSKGTENKDHTMKDGTDTVLFSPKLAEQPVEFAANEDTSAEEIQQNAEESNSTDKDFVPEQCSKDSSVLTSEIDDPEMDGAKVVTELSKDTSSDHPGTKDSSTESVALTEEVIQETNLPSEASLPREETESHTPCISEGEELNVQLKTTDNKSVDEKPTEEDMSSDLTKKVAPEQEAIENERMVEDIINTAAEEVSHENSTSLETITILETSNSDELQSKSGLNSSLSEEEETTVQEAERSLTTSKDYGVPSENTLSESHAEVECHSKTLEDAATDHTNPELAEKSEKSSPIQVDDSQLEHDEQLEEENEIMPLTEALTGGINDNVSAAMDKVKDEDEDHKEAEFSEESEQSTRCTLVKEDVQIENPAESLHVALENIEVSNFSQENKIKVLPEDQSTNAILHETKADEATIDAADPQKDDHESFPPIVSGSLEEGNMNAVLQEVTSDHSDGVDKHEEVIENLSTTLSTEDAEGNSLSKLDLSENKREDDSGKECEKKPSLPLAREVSDVSTFLHEARLEAEEPKKAELCDNERGTESMLLNTESTTENTEDVNSEDTNAPDLVDERSEGGTVDAAEEKEETLENVPTIVPNEKMEENSFIQVDGQEMESKEYLDKENEQVSSIKDHTGNTDNDEVIVKDEDEIEDENPSGAELFEKDKNTGSVLLTEEVQREKPVESLNAAFDDVKTSDFCQHTEATGILEEHIPAEKSQGIPSDETDETAIDAANTNEKTQELQNVSNEDSDKDLPVEVDASEMKHDTNLEEEPERPSLIEATKEDPNDDESSIRFEPKTGDECVGKVELPNDEESTDCTTPKKESLQPEDHTTSTSSADIETTCSLEGQSLADNSKTIISDKTTDAADKKEFTLENVATETPHEHIEENLVTQVDCTEREKDDQNSSLTEAPEETNARESKDTDELKNRDEDSIQPELENRENTESTSVKEETEVEKPIDSSQVKPEDIKQHDSSPDINNSIEEQISNKDSREISIVNTERESVDAAPTNEESVEIKDVAKDIPECDKGDSIPIEVGSPNPLNEPSAGNANDEESMKITEGSLIKEEESLESSQVADQDIETPPSARDRETSSLDEQSTITNPEGIIVDNKEEIADNASGAEDDTPKDTDIGKDISGCNKEDNMPIEEVGSQKPLDEASVGNANDDEMIKLTEGSLIKEEQSFESLQVAAQDIETPPLGLDRETSSPDSQIPIANPGETMDDHEEEIADSATGVECESPKDKNISNTTLYEETEENLQVQEDCSQLEQNEDLENESENIPSTETPEVPFTESSPVKEEEKVEKPTEEQTLTADPQETCDKTQEKAVDAANKNNDVVISVPSGDSEDKSPIEVEGSQKPSSEEIPAEKIDHDEPTATHEANFADENSVKPNLFEDEEKIECALVKEEVHIESLQVADEDIKDTSSSQDREVSHLEEQEPTTDSHGSMGDQKDAKTLDLTDPKEETLEDKNYATTPHEDTKQDSLQLDGSLLEQKEHSEKDSESTSSTHAPKDDITESTLVEEVAQVEDPIDSSQVATEDTKVFAPCKETDRSSIVEQILDSKDISSYEITEKIADATGEETQEAQDIAKTVPHEDDSPNEQNTEATLVNEDVSIESPQVAAEDTKEPCLSEVQETCSQEERILSASPGVLINDNKENETIDPTDFQKETPKDEEPKEMESIDVKAATKEEEGYLEGVQTTTAVNIVVSNQEKSSNFTAEKTPCAEEDLNVNKDVIGHIPEVSIYKQKESSITKVSEEHIVTSNEHVSDSTRMESEVSEKNDDRVDGEANTCGDKTDLERIEVLNDGSTAVPTSESLEEKDPRGCTETEVQVPNEEEVAEVIKQEAENDQKNIKETLPNYTSEDVSELNEVKGEEDLGSNNYEEISSIPICVASEEVSTSIVALEGDSTSNSSQELRRDIREEAESEEVQKQEPTLQVSELIQDLSVEKIEEEDAQSCLASANDSGITEEMQKLKKVPLPAPEDNIIETTDCKESDVMEVSTNDECIDHQEQDDATKSFSDDKKPEKEQETVANDILPATFGQTPGVDHSPTERELTNREEPYTGKTETGDDKEISDKGNDDEKEACEEKMSNISSPDMMQERDIDVSMVDSTDGKVIHENTSVDDILVNRSSVTDLETKNDDEAPEIKETTPSSSEGQDAENASVEENSNYAGSLTEEKSDSNEVAITPGENKGGYASNDQGLESVAQVQSCDIISKTEEENLEAEAEIQSDKAVTEDILQEETTCEIEIMKGDTSSEKEQLPRIREENEDIKEYHQGSRVGEVITYSHQEDKVNQDQQINSRETDGFTKNANETETVAKVSEEVDDKAPEDLEEKIVTNEAIERILYQEEQVAGIQEPTTKIDNEKARELDIACVKTDTLDTNKEVVQIAIIPGRESVQHNKKDEICSPDEVQAKDEEKLMLSEGKNEEEAKETYREAYVEAEKLDFASQPKDITECALSDGSQDIPEDNENSTTKNKFSEEGYPNKSTECEVSSASDDIAPTEQSSEDSIVTAEVQEEKAGIDLQVAVSEATGLESRGVEELNDKCVEMEDTSTQVQTPAISTSKIIPEHTEGPLEAKDQQTKLHDLPEGLNMRDSEVKMAEKDDAVNIQSVRDVSEDVQELCNESLEVSNNESPVEGNPEEKIETSEGRETKPIQNAPVSENLEQEIGDQQLGRGTEDVHEEGKDIYNIPNQLGSPYGAETEKDLESSICQSSVGDTAQHDKKEGNQQIDSALFIPHAQCSDNKTSEKDLPVHVGGLGGVDVTELEASPLSLKDKHVVLETDDTRNLTPENLDGDKNISTGLSQGELGIVKPSKVEQEEEECGNEERADQEIEGKPESEETDKPSLSDLFQVSTKETSQMADHSLTEKEPASHTEDLHAVNSDEAEHENSKTDEEKDDEEESHEQGKSDLSSEAPVMVEMGDADMKVTPKKSHNILSGVGSKVKHSIAKVKKAITGKSSHTKSPSPKKAIN